MFNLNPHSGIPIYKQLMDQTRWMIASGQLQPGDSLPSVRELALEHAVNVMTISKAYSLLEAEGMLVRQRGKPMTVADQNAGREHKSERLKRLAPVIEQLTTAASQLHLTTEDVVAVIRQEMEKKP